MGRIALVLDVETVNEADVKSNEIKLDIGGGQVLRVAQYSQPGIDSKPFPDDTCVTSSTPGDAGETVVGFLDPKNESAVENGETRVYSRKAGGDVSISMHFKNDGTIEIGDNTDALALASKVNEQLEKLIDLLSGGGSPVPYWVPVPQDGGTALQTAAAAIFPTGYTATDSEIVKVQK